MVSPYSKIDRKVNGWDEMLMDQISCLFCEPIKGRLNEGRIKAFNRKGNLAGAKLAKATA
ncbi:MAG TPA: hypothetical protein DDY49_15620 [Paenibacillaceae bacterium]|nr:hypothetical protein [Paenibacillaceae bacterium]